MSANVVFINIDWKLARHNQVRLSPNMRILGATIAGVVRNMKPAMICMSEVGEANIPLTEEHMQQVADKTMQTRRDAATERVKLHSMFKVGAPYMTVFNVSQVRCSGHRILTNIYYTRGKPHSAHTFMCCGPGDVTVDIRNVHAPSGIPRLTDRQHKELFRNLLRNNSMSIS